MSIFSFLLFVPLVISLASKFLNKLLINNGFTVFTLSTFDQINYLKKSDRIYALVLARNAIMNRIIGKTGHSIN